VLSAKYYSGDQIKKKKKKKGGVCGSYGGEEGGIPGFYAETGGKENTLKT
jgi:hypothetical protein